MNDRKVPFYRIWSDSIKTVPIIYHAINPVFGDTDNPPSRVRSVICDSAREGGSPSRQVGLLDVLPVRIYPGFIMLSSMIFRGCTRMV